MKRFVLGENLFLMYSKNSRFSCTHYFKLVFYRRSEENRFTFCNYELHQEAVGYSKSILLSW